MKRMLAIVVAAVTTLSFAPSASATPAPAPGSRVATVSVSSAELSAASADLTRARQFMKATPSGLVSFDQAAARSSGLSATTVREIATGVAAANVDLANPAVAAACNGRNRYISHWYGPELWLNSCNANSIRILAQGGAALATIAAAILALTGLGIPAGAVVALAGGIIALGSVAMAWCNRNNRGVKIYKLLWAGPFYCTQQ